MKNQAPRILVLGLEDSGKTTIMKALSKGEISTKQLAKGLNIETTEQEEFKLVGWDIGSQKASK